MFTGYEEEEYLAASAASAAATAAAEIEDTKETLFVPPVITLEKDKIDIDIVSQENGYFVTKKVGTENPYKDLTIPTVFVDNRVLAESTYIMENKAKTKDEVCLFYIIKKMNDKFPLFLAYGYFITEQEVSGVEVEADGPDTRRYYKWLQENYEDEFISNLHRKILPVHSHHSMGDTWSGTDLKQQNSRGDMGFCDDYRMYAVWTLQNQLRMSYVQYFPIYHRIENINVGIKISSLNFHVDRQRRMELDAIVKELVLDKRPAATTAISYANHNYNQSNWASWPGIKNPTTPTTTVTKFPNSAYALNKYKLINFMEIIEQMISKFLVKFPLQTHVKQELQTAASAELYNAIVENLPSVDFLPTEITKIRHTTTILARYMFDEFASSLPVLEKETVDECLLNYAAIMEEMTNNINNWVDDDAENIYQLRTKLTNKTEIEQMDIIDNILFDMELKIVTREEGGIK